MPLSSLSSLSIDKDKPYLIYVARTDADRSESKLFANETIVVASRFFRCFRIEENDVPKGKIRDKYLLKKGPTFIILDAKGNEVTRNSKKATKGWISKSMKKQFAKDYGSKLTTHTKKILSWLNDLEKAEDNLANAQRAHASVEERMAKKEETARSKKRIEKSAAKLEAAKKKFDELINLGEELSNPQEKSLEVAKK